MNDIDTDEQAGLLEYYGSLNAAVENQIKRVTTLESSLTIWSRLFETKKMNTELQLVKEVKSKIKVWIDVWHQQNKILLEIITNMKQSGSFEEAHEFAVVKMSELEQLQQLEIKSRPVEEIAAIEKAGKKIKNFEKEIQKIIEENNSNVLKS